MTYCRQVWEDSLSVNAEVLSYVVTIRWSPAYSMPSDVRCVLFRSFDSCCLLADIYWYSILGKLTTMTLCDET